MEPADCLRRTPLYAQHVALGARMVPFAGWEMPVQYEGVLSEARAVRSTCGLFDISHMGRFVVSGVGALPLLDLMTTNDVRGLEPGRAHYTLLTNDDGGIVDDLIIYRVAPDRFLLVVNAANAAGDLAWLQQHAGPDVTIADITGETAMMALQGPAAVRTAEAATSEKLETVERFGFRELAGGAQTWCRTGYTGEDGFEVIVPANAGEVVWRTLAELGAIPCGLGARDVLRTEAGYPLYGHEIDGSTTPVEAGLMWVVRLDKGPFLGRDRVAAARESPPPRRLMGIVSSGRIVPRHGYTLAADGEEAGVVTSGVFSPTRGCGIGMAYIARSHAHPGYSLTMPVRADRHEVRVVARRELLPRP